MQGQSIRRLKSHSLVRQPVPTWVILGLERGRMHAEPEIEQGEERDGPGDP